MNIEITATPPADWDAYVGQHAERTAYHRAASVLVGPTCFGLRVHFLVARSPYGGIVGVLPLVAQSSVVFGSFLTSVPFFTYGGLLVDGPDAAAALIDAADGIRRASRARHVELRHTAPFPELGLQARMEKMSMVLPLPGDIEELNRALGAKLRSQIRRADREAPEILWGGAELLPLFHKVFRSAMHRLGTPVYPLRFFRQVAEALAASFSVLVVRHGNEVAAAAILVRHGNRMEVPWAAASDDAKKRSLNMRMYWELLVKSVAAGATEFDFGRSTEGSGTYRFKAQWGALPRQLYWHYCLPEGQPLPVLNQSNPKFALAVRAWTLMPEWLANALGPFIVRNLP